MRLNASALAVLFAVLAPAVAAGQAFTADPIVPGETPVKAVHFTELQSQIDAVRALVGLRAYAWAVRLEPGDTIRATHMRELRTALEEAYSSAARTRPAWSGGGVEASALVRATHINELRDAVVRLEDVKPDLVVGGQGSRRPGSSRGSRSSSR